jgi:hypothetical protein
VQYRIVDRRTQHPAKRAGAKRRVIVDVARLRTTIPNHLVRQCVKLQKVHPDIGTSDERAQHLGDEPPGRSHLLDLGRGPILDHPEILPYAATATRKLRFDTMRPELVEGQKTTGFDRRRPELVEGLGPQAMPAEAITQ